tara:strand:- start:1017 stop:1244 length:228 start_codon:yes stop_codon:yes gene_type:complete
MSALSDLLTQSGAIYIDANNWDPMDTLAPLLGDLPHDQVPDTPENRLKVGMLCTTDQTFAKSRERFIRYKKFARY